jgi:hypothetical protein
MRDTLFENGIPESVVKQVLELVFDKGIVEYTKGQLERKGYPEMYGGMCYLVRKD